MKFSQGERETLTGPAVVGIALGIVFAVCTVAFNSEYNEEALFDWATKIGHAMLIFSVDFYWNFFRLVWLGFRVNWTP